VPLSFTSVPLLLDRQSGCNEGLEGRAGPSLHLYYLNWADKRSSSIEQQQ
jgi:hypothetical protein